MVRSTLIGSPKPVSASQSKGSEVACVIVRACSTNSTAVRSPTSGTPAEADRAAPDKYRALKPKRSAIRATSASKTPGTAMASWAHARRNIWPGDNTLFFMCSYDTKDSKRTTKDKKPMTDHKHQIMGSREQGKRSGRIYLWLSAGFMMILGGVAAYLFLDRELFQGNSALMRKLENADLSAEPSDPNQVGNWPAWRGPRRDGWSQETGLLSKWPESGPKLIWQAKTGAGYSDLAVASGKAVTLLQEDKDEAVVCWDADTGNELWRFKYASQYL